MNQGLLVRLFFILLVKQPHSNLDKNQGTVHDVYDQLGMLKSISKKAIRINNAEEALEKLIDAVEIALTPPMGPVQLRYQ